MSLIKNNALVGASGQAGYFIDRSLRFRSSASAYLNRTPASAGNQKTWTWSGWVKRGTLTTDQMLFSTSNTYIRFGNGTTDNIWLNMRGAGATNYFFQTTAIYRDPSAWYHIVVAVDTTQATSSNRVKLYVNNVQVTAFTTYADYPPQNTDTGVNSTAQHNLGSYGTPSIYFDGYLTDINLIDGQALDPTYFGEYNSATGVWQPKKYSGTYGTNGFYLNFSDNTSTTTLGYDTSGNSNNWTANNISVTSGATYDSMTDVPTLTSEDAANYCTLSPIDYVTAAPTNSNLTLTNGFARATMAIPSTGKWYWENTIGASSNNSCGLSPASSSVSEANGSSGFYAYFLNGNKYTAGTSSSYAASYTNGDVISVAVDADAGTVTFYKNNVSQGVAFTGLDFSSPWLPLARPITSATTDINFGQRPFAYTPPTGFKSLNTYNLPDSTIEDGSQYFDTVLWTGNGTDPQSISGLNFQPDFVWAKSRSGGQSHVLTDAVRGATKTLYADTTLAETTSSLLTAFNSDGFDVEGGLNTSARTLVGWSWKANGSGVSNTDGSTTSTVSANTTAGFSIVTYTGTGSAATVGHGLGVAPGMIIVKERTSTSGWFVYTSITGAGNYLSLNSTGASAGSTSIWNNTAPTSSVFSVGANNGTNENTQDYVAYCFTDDVEGYSKFGSYTGNGSTNGPFVYTGFRPRWVMVKLTSLSGAGWAIMDTSRVGYNVANNDLYANLANAEATSSYLDILSNGFKFRSSAGDVNGSGRTYIYMAFAENPFKNSLAR